MGLPEIQKDTSWLLQCEFWTTYVETTHWSDGTELMAKLCGNHKNDRQLCVPVSSISPEEVYMQPALPEDIQQERKPYQTTAPFKKQEGISSE